MKKVFGGLFVLIGVGVGLYVGGYLCFVQGIIDIVETIRTGTFDGGVIAWSVVKMMFASLIGLATGVIPAFIGCYLWAD